jgi:hypothetical protein
MIRNIDFGERSFGMKGNNKLLLVSFLILLSVNYSCAQNTSNKGRDGLSLGFLYLRASYGKGTYVQDAYVDPNGVIRTHERYDSLIRVMPSVTRHWDCKKSFGGYIDFICSPYSVIGVTAAIGNGYDSSSKGMSFALGGTYGWTSESALMGITLGSYYDNSIKELPTGYRLDQPYVYQSSIIKRDGTPEAYLTNKTIDIPLRNVSAQFYFIGLTITANLNFKDETTTTSGVKP